MPKNPKFHSIPSVRRPQKIRKISQIAELYRLITVSISLCVTNVNIQCCIVDIHINFIKVRLKKIKSTESSIKTIELLLKDMKAISQFINLKIFPFQKVTFFKFHNWKQCDCLSYIQYSTLNYLKSFNPSRNFIYTIR